MKFIDEKGKIFGRINLIDFLVILFLLGLTPVFYLGNKALTHKWAVKDYKKISIKIKCASVMPELAGFFREGDIVKDNEGNTIGVLKKIISNVPSEIITINQFNLRNNDYFLVPNPSGRDVVCLFDVNCTEERGVLFFNNYAVKIGNSVVLSTDSYNFQGVIIDFDNAHLAEKKGNK
ncbi:MAG: DUF4330 domain-containing protein [Candidatus Omnitrophica bacterium]|nr:DUF4330 domain-containing protein [Candidatus Omnitrophota bacterium]MDD5545954.1 DUF4330 domain-containing protein [Candidatus Omnitrophota bacterium]